MFIEKISKNGSFSTSAGNQVYDQSAYPSERAANGDVLAVTTMIRNVLRSKISTLRQNTNSASVVISIVQEFNGAVSTIVDKLTQMKKLVNDVARGSTTHTASERAEMQEQFKVLAAEINAIVGSTEHDGNKLLSSDGETASVDVVKGETIQISPRDLSFDASELELIVGVGGPALAAVETAIEQAHDLSKYFGDKLVELDAISKQFDFDYINNLGAEPSVGDSILAIKEATGVMSEIIASDAMLIDIQANVNSDVALWLLKT